MSPSSPGFLKAQLSPGKACQSGFLQLPLPVFGLSRAGRREVMGFGQGRRWVGRVCVTTVVAGWAAKEEEGRGPGPDLGSA